MTRKSLPGTRKSVTHTVVISTNMGIDADAPVTVNITVGLYTNGKPGEVFLSLENENDGPYEQWAILLSLLLQHGVSFQMIHDKLAWATYGPGGLTDNKEIRSAKSITDYVVRWMAKEFKLVEEK